MSEMVERVAGVLAKNRCAQGGRDCLGIDPECVCLEDARAAIAAMAIPNDKMVLSGMLMAAYVANEGPTNQACSIWTAMHEAALEPVDDEGKA